MRLEFVDQTGRMSRQPAKYVFEVGVRVVTIDFGRLDQTHDGSSAFASPQGPGE
jgi:hypothetical protein